MIITISGKPGSGKSAVAKILARKLNYKLHSTGDLRGEIAMNHNLTIDELNRLGEKERWTDEECDNLTIELGRTKDNMVIDSWLAWHFIPQAIKVFLDVDLSEAAKRIFKNQRPDEKRQDTVKGVERMITSRMEQTIKRFKRWYGVDFLDMRNYDILIDTTNISKEKAAALIIKYLRDNKGK